VDTKKIIQRRGPLAIAGRYSCKRPLEWDIAIEPKAVLGSGMGGDVRRGRCLASGRRYAVKTLRKQRISSRTRELARSEAEVYLQLDHPHIAKLERVYETPEELHLVMEPLEGGELYERIVKSARSRYSEEQAAEAMRQMLLAVSYLHAQGFVHRDVKPENFLYEDAQCNFIKLIDFGFARGFEDGERMRSACGTLQYTAPEVMKQSYTEKADVWSLGIVTYVMLCGTLPWSATEDKQISKQVAQGALYWSRSRFEPLSEGAKHFVRSLLSDPDCRPSAAEALQHPWISERSQLSGATARGLDAQVVERMRTFARAPRWQRACWTLLARSSSSPTAASSELREQFLSLANGAYGALGRSDLREIFGGDDAEVEELIEGLDLSGAGGEIAYSDFLAAASFQEPCADTFHAFDLARIDAEEARALLSPGDYSDEHPSAFDTPSEKAAAAAHWHHGPSSPVETAIVPLNDTEEQVWKGLSGAFRDLSTVLAAVLRLFDFGLGIQVGAAAAAARV
jgi:calcium-dependent protein kinase